MTTAVPVAIATFGLGFIFGEVGLGLLAAMSVLSTQAFGRWLCGGRH